jgi:hypothetical protein
MVRQRRDRQRVRPLATHLPNPAVLPRSGAVTPTASSLVPRRTATWQPDERHEGSDFWIPKLNTPLRSGEDQTSSAPAATTVRPGLSLVTGS